MMRIPGLTLALILVTACAIRTAPAPATPLSVRALSVAPPRQVIRAAARELTAAGFIVTAIDSTSRLSAEHEHHPGQFEGTLICRSADTPARAAAVAPTMIIDLAVQPRDGGSELVVASRVNATYLRLSADPTRPTDARDCQSTGVVEQKLANRLAGAM